MGNVIKFFAIALVVSGLIIPLFSFANGGDQRVLGNEYLVNLSRSPFTPVVGTKTSMIVSFVDLKTRALIQEDMLVTVRVTKGRGSKDFIHEEKNLSVKGGILEWSYTFADPGIHELFFDFAFVSDPQTVYEPPDFLLDIQKSDVQVKNDKTLFVAILTLLLGGVIGWFIGRRKT
jgi:hypothetical protein